MPPCSPISIWTDHDLLTTMSSAFMTSPLRPLNGEDYQRRKGPVYQLIWGRHITPEAAGKFLEHVDAKMAALEAHATQITTDGPFFALSNNVGSTAWGVEFYRLAKGRQGPVGEDGLETDLFAGL